MAFIRLPENAKDILDHSRVNVPDSYEDKWLLHNIVPGCEDDVWELFRTAVREEGGFEPKDDEYEQFGWCWPANQESHPVHSVQDVLDFHLAIVQKRIAGEPTQQKHFVYEFGFVVIDRADWREKGVIAVSDP